MKIPVSFIVSIVSCSCLLFFSCGKEVIRPIDETYEVGSTRLIESAKRQFHAQIDPEAPSIKRYGALHVFWKDSKTIITVDDTTRLVVPAADFTMNNVDFTFKRYVIFRISGNKIEGGRIVEFMGNKYDVHLNADFLLRNYTQKIIKGYNGSVFQYDFSYRQKEGATYKNGEKMPGVHTFIATGTYDQLLQPLTVPPTTDPSK